MYFYLPSIEQGRQYMLADVVSHFKARRLRVGDSVKLFDGTGKVAHAKILQLDKRQAECEIISIEITQPKHYPRLVMGVTKWPTLEFILQKAVEIGVREILLLVCDNTPIKCNQAIFEQKRDRLEKIIIAACEQSESVFKPTLSCQMFADYQPDGQTIMLHPYVEDTWGQGLGKEKISDIMVGPEGGFTEEEVRCGAKCYKLNTGILRADTAAIASLLLAQLL